MQLQILLPQINFGETFKKLSDHDLEVVRRESAQLFAEVTMGLVQDSSARAWSGYEYGLCIYAMQASMEFGKRGFRDDLSPRVAKLMQKPGLSHEYRLPPWIGDLTVHRAHRAYLIRQNPAYARVWPGTDATLPMVAPVLSPNHIDGYYLETIGE